MSDAETLRFIREEIKRQLNIILPGVSQNSTGQVEDIFNMFPGMDAITARPTVHPYGFVSSAPSGTPQVTGRMGSHIGNRLILGHRDPNRPTLNEGEVIIYDQFGHLMYFSEDKIQIGSKNADENAVLGQVLKGLLSDLLQLLATHTHITTIPGVNTTPPNEAPQFTAFKADPVDNENMLSDVTFVEKG